ncbi:ATP-binding cassette domain-containing protein [endosymbiont GvMRE of Glomus versiforme]|uniref:ATP-binding cassette domain-containing protein n=1 Tax=endosymbiont GvMRE of Glomus versiforme TaxID=2039283 RepID=UPI000EBCC1A4|nr:ABC transporter ATP-binding protein [endosymbiont GvMRE of Glomus versiforme]RHZ37130.1 ABC transporter ATP-binding protein [endosymbiont GvMRE of Glomus versiforme]
MPQAAIFTPTVIQQKKKSKFKLLWLVFLNIVKNNLSLFLFNVFLAIITAIINFNIRLNLKEAFAERSEISILDYKGFSFSFFPFGRFGEGIGFWGFFLSFLFLSIVGKGIFSLLHYYWMNYSYERVENDLTKDLFHHFVQAKYPHSSQVSRNLFTQFTLLDRVARDTWFIVNRGFYVFTSIIFLCTFDFIARTRNYGFPLRFTLVVLFLFAITFAIQYFLFKRATKLNIAKKHRYEKENRHIFERINNLEYIKTTSGENYEQKKLNKLLDRNFQKNKKSLLWSVFFQAIPQFILMPNINIFFIVLSGLSTFWLVPSPAENQLFFFITFVLIYITVSDLRGEVEKIVQASASLDDLSGDLSLVMESMRTLHEEKKVLPANLPFENGDIAFEKVVFAYPARLNNTILRNFTFCFHQGKSYGIAGKNGIGKSTVTKTLLKLYDLQEGKISIAGKNVQDIDTKTLHQRICYLTNRPGFFQMSIAENVFYPYSSAENEHTKEKLEQLTYAAKKAEIWEFIETLPQGFQTELKEKGSDLSEGQKQQIATMRIFVRDYDIYIFDEILSNVQKDLKTKILANIFSHLKNKTVIVIDHHYDIFQYINEVYQFTGERLIKLEKENY